MICFAAVTAVTGTINGKGIREKNTVALTIGEHEISNAELNYYFIESVNNFYNNYGAYASLFGLDLTKPLNEQYVDEENGLTWADDFMTAAIENAEIIYTLNDAAKAAGFTLSEELQAEIDSSISNAELYALYYYGYSNLEDYLKAMYGKGATVESYRNFCEMTYIANEFQTQYNNSLSYEDADLREAEAENYDAYSSYSYNHYYLSTSKFDDAAAAEEAAKTLTADDITTVEELDAAIAALPMNAESTSAASNANTDVLYSSVSSIYRDWVVDASRKAGDLTYVPSTSTSTDENGNETTNVTGYYVIMFNGVNENTFPLVNVRHILAAFEGGNYDSATGITTYSDEEKLTAKQEAEELLKQWKEGKANEASFGILADEKSDDGDGTTGGLYTNIYPGQMVTNFNNWCFDASRQVGDTGIVETEYGYHVMFFAGNAEQTYRDLLIENDLRNNDFTAWYTALTADITSEVGNTKYISTDLVLSPAE